MYILSSSVLLSVELGSGGEVFIFSEYAMAKKSFLAGINKVYFTLKKIIIVQFHKRQNSNMILIIHTTPENKNNVCVNNWNDIKHQTMFHNSALFLWLNIIVQWLVINIIQIQMHRFQSQNMFYIIDYWNTFTVKPMQFGINFNFNIKFTCGNTRFECHR